MIETIIALVSLCIIKPIYTIVWFMCLVIFVSVKLYLFKFKVISLLYILIYIGAITILFIFMVYILKIEYHKDELFEEDWGVFMHTILLVVVPMSYTMIRYYFKDTEMGVFTIDIRFLEELVNIGAVLYSEYMTFIVLLVYLLVLVIIGIITLKDD